MIWLPIGGGFGWSEINATYPGLISVTACRYARARRVISSRWVALFPDPAYGPLLARAPVVWSSLIFCCPPGVLAMPALGERSAGGRTAAT